VLEVTRRLIDETLSRGPAVLVGRGAQALLQTRDDAMHVFCAAPFAGLVARVAERERLSREEAEKLVREKNQQRAQYVKRYWDRDWTAAEHYHLCLDTSWFGIAASAELITEVARLRFG
jgi:cytidylate kinase